ncbi:hypothetical protein BCR39DRAFT_518310 [Naematelia encephala]|uniref:Uncharacterized protein n=1 Tax=Naematelia encephala TaxID=71784 RepID=A0A1Y2BHL2_9TREE|nr:hypothetical protein BCR39DRAFT_518310 [Naematelia encephala]
MASYNDTSVNPQGVEGAYAGVMNTTETKGGDTAAVGPDLLGDTGKEIAAKQNVIEGGPGIIESTELAPLGEEKVAADPGLASQATKIAKDAYNSVVGE